MLGVMCFYMLDIAGILNCLYTTLDEAHKSLFAGLTVGFVIRVVSGFPGRRPMGQLFGSDSAYSGRRYRSVDSIIQSLRGMLKHLIERFNQMHGVCCFDSDMFVMLRQLLDR